MITVNSYPGYYIILDGIVGCGKGEQAKLLPGSISKLFPDIPVVSTFEPGGTPVANELRQILKYQTLGPLQEAEIFARARGSTLAEVVRPALSKGAVVISDRGFTTSLAYQAFGRQLGLDMVWGLNEKVIGGTYPDCVIFLNVGLAPSLERSGKVDPDKFDGEDGDFWRRTIDGYAEGLSFLKRLSPHTKIIRIDDSEGKIGIEETQELVMARLKPSLEVWAALREGAIKRERDH